MRVFRSDELISFFFKRSRKMNNHQIILVVAGIISLCSGNIIIESPRETNWGEWGAWERCPFGSVGVQAIQIRTEPFQGVGPNQDDTAMNAIRLYCGDPSLANSTIISSSQGSWGNWGNLYTCRSDDRPGLAPDGIITGFQLRVEPNLNAADDSATNNIRIFCNYPGLGIPQQMKEADGLTFGSWTTAQHCNYNQVVCGIQTQIEGYQGDGDDTALNNIKLECCDR